MNLLTINSYDCSALAGGGVNQVTVTLFRYFTHHCNIRCFLGYFECIAPKFKQLQEVVNSIHLNRKIDKEKFSHFLIENKIDIIQINYLKKENICAMPQIYEVAHQLDIKVIYAFHMEPLFQIGVYAPREMVWYSIRYNVRILETLKFRLYTIFKRELDPIISRFLRKKYKEAYDSCDKIVTLSKNYIQPYKDIAGITESNKFIAIGNESRYERYLTKEEINNKQNIVLVLARFSEDTKRLSISMRCWRRLEKEELFPDWKLQMVGDGKDMNFYKYLASKWKLKRVEFTGLQDPYEYGKRASLLLMASGTEGWPMVLMEATQLGLPVIVMNSYGAVYDIITDGYNGTIIENNNIDAYYQAMVDLMKDKQKRLEYACNAVESSKRFEVSNVAEQWIALFNELSRNKCYKID